MCAVHMPLRVSSARRTSHLCGYCAIIPSQMRDQMSSTAATLLVALLSLVLCFVCTLFASVQPYMARYAFAMTRLRFGSLTPLSFGKRTAGRALPRPSDAAVLCWRLRPLGPQDHHVSRALSRRRCRERGDAAAGALARGVHDTGAALRERVCGDCHAVFAAADAEVAAFGTEFGIAQVLCLLVFPASSLSHRLLLCLRNQVTLFLFPISFFYYFLYYTDTCSTLSLVLLQYLSCSDDDSKRDGGPPRSNWRRQLAFTLVRPAPTGLAFPNSALIPLLLAQVACASILFRQTNAVWVAFYIGVNVVQQLEKMQAIKYAPTSQFTQLEMDYYLTSPSLCITAAMTRQSGQ